MRLQLSHGYNRRRAKGRVKRATKTKSYYTVVPKSCYSPAPKTEPFWFPTGTRPSETILAKCFSMDPTNPPPSTCPAQSLVLSCSPSSLPRV